MDQRLIEVCPFLSIQPDVCLKMMVLDVCHKDRKRGQLDGDLKYVFV